MPIGWSRPSPAPLTSYYNAGALPDPNYGDNQLAISDSFFYADFWYRNEFAMPAPTARQTRMAELRRHQLESRRLFQRRETGTHRRRIHARPLRYHQPHASGQKNALAVRVEKNATPGSIKEKTFDNPG
jgi:hypothetical protein